jgi:hypothetical protein
MNICVDHNNVSKLKVYKLQIIKQIEVGLDQGFDAVLGSHV